jgi:hypothetical protein
MSVWLPYFNAVLVVSVNVKFRFFKKKRKESTLFYAVSWIRRKLVWEQRE